MRKVLREDGVRRNLDKIDEASGLSWLQGHLDCSVAPLLAEPWVRDRDTTIKPLYGEQEGAELGYNPHKAGSAVALLSHLHAVEPATGLECGCAARRPAQRQACHGRSVVVAGPVGPRPLADAAAW